MAGDSQIPKHNDEISRNIEELIIMVSFEVTTRFLGMPFENFSALNRSSGKFLYVLLTRTYLPYFSPISLHHRALG